MKDAKPGDILVGNAGGDSLGHTGIYLGDGKMLHAPAPGQNVKIQSISGWFTVQQVLDPY
jgi:cell wall-associated NlpC family hydrolase